MNETNIPTQPRQNILTMLLLSVVVAVVSSVVTVLLMTSITAKNVTQAETAETYVGEPVQSNMLNRFEDNIRGVRNAGQDLGELKDNYEKPVIDLKQFLPK